MTYTLGPGIHQLRWDASFSGTPDPFFPAEGVWIDQFHVAAPDDAILAGFAPPLPGARVSGPSLLVEPGKSDATALAVIVNPGETSQLEWPLAPPTDDRLRLLSFQTKGTGYGEVFWNGHSKSWGASVDWQEVVILIPPFLTEIHLKMQPGFQAQSSAAFALDDLKVEVINTVPIAPLLGPDGHLFTPTAWYGAEKDAATYGYATRVVHDDPAVGVEWASTISDENSRNNALVETGRTFFKKNPEAAAQWLPSSGLPSELQQKISKR